MVTFRTGQGGQTGQWLGWVHMCVLISKAGGLSFLWGIRLEFKALISRYHRPRSDRDLCEMPRCFVSIVKVGRIRKELWVNVLVCPISQLRVFRVVASG